MNEKQKELEQRQETNEAIVNVPTEFMVSGRKVEVKSLSLRRMIKVDKLIIKLNKLATKDFTSDNIEYDISQKDYLAELDEREQKTIEYYETFVDILSLIINDNDDNPEFDKDWIMDNISVSGEGSIGEQILDAYNKHQSALPFCMKALASRKM